MNISPNYHLTATPNIQRTGTKGSVPLKSEEEIQKAIDRAYKNVVLYESKQKAKKNPLIHNPLVNMIVGAKNAFKNWVVGPDAPSGPPPYDKY